MSSMCQCAVLAFARLCSALSTLPPLRWQLERESKETRESEMYPATENKYTFVVAVIVRAISTIFHFSSLFSLFNPEFP